MSRIGNLPVTVPAGVKVTPADGTIQIEGALGTLEQAIAPKLRVVVDAAARQIRVERDDDERQTKALHALTIGPPEPSSMLIVGVGAVPCVTLRISRIDKQQVGEFAARLRRLKPPEPYKAKGIRYEGEEIRRKAGKAFAAQE